MPSTTLDNTRSRARQSGFDLFGVVEADRFDACQPKEQRLRTVLPRCGVAVVVGRGGQHATGFDAAAGLQQLLADLIRDRRRAVVVTPGRAPLSFARLAEAAGFGTVSPVTGLLLHPEFGPWVLVHGAVLVEGNPFGAVDDAAISDHFQPCCSCRQPCLEVIDGPATACHIGTEHGNGAAVPAPQLVGAPAPRRLLGLAVHRLVPRFRRR